MTTPNTEACTAEAAVWIERLELAFAVEPGELVGKGRDRYLMPIRAVLAQALRLRGYSTPAIGAAIGGRNHTSIMRILEAWPLDRALATLGATARGQRPDVRRAVETVLAEARSGKPVAHRLTVDEQKKALPPVTLVAEGRTLRLDAHDPEAMHFRDVVERLRATKRKQRRAIWAAYCRTAFPLTAKHQSLVMPVGIAG